MGRTIRLPWLLHPISSEWSHSHNTFWNYRSVGMCTCTVWVHVVVCVYCVWENVVQSVRRLLFVVCTCMPICCLYRVLQNLNRKYPILISPSHLSTHPLTTSTYFYLNTTTHTYSLPLTHLHTHHNTHRAAILTCLIGCFTVSQMHGDQPVKLTWLMWKSLFQSSSISPSSWWTATTLTLVCALPNVAVPHRNLIIPSHISTTFILHSAIVLNFNKEQGSYALCTCLYKCFCKAWLSPPLTEGQQYCSLNAVMWLKYVTISTRW